MPAQHDRESRVLQFEVGRQGGVIARLPSGKVVLPARGFNPRAGEVWEVEIEERDRYAIARPVFRKFIYPGPSINEVEIVVRSGDVICSSQIVHAEIESVELSPNNPNYVVLRYVLPDGDRFEHAIPLLQALVNPQLKSTTTLMVIRQRVAEEFAKMAGQVEEVLKRIVTLREELMEVAEIIRELEAVEEAINKVEKEMNGFGDRQCPHGIPHKKVVSHVPDELFTHDYEVEVSYVIQCPECLEKLRALDKQRKDLADKYTQLVAKKREIIRSKFESAVGKIDTDMYVVLFMVVHGCAECPFALRPCPKLFPLLYSQSYREFALNYQPFNLQYIIENAGKQECDIRDFERRR